MRIDTLGVAGFFEDLPVLLLVLAGVSSVALTGAWCAEQHVESAREEGLSATAEAIVRSTLFAASDGGSSPLSVDALFALDPEDLTDAGSACAGWVVVIEVVHPMYWRHELPSGTPSPCTTDLGWASELVNAAYEGDLVAIVEVTGVAW